MAHYTGYVTIPHSTYAEWKSEVLNNSYDADGLYGAQCWDLVAEFWYNLGFGTGYPLTGGNDAKGVWPLREQNKGNQFDLIYNIEDVLQGDVMCFSGPYATGHIAFADENYPQGSTYMNLLGQNQGGGEPAPGGGTTTTVESFNISSFQGAFRYKGWHSSPTPSASGKSKFPWVLYARKIRARTRA